MFLVLRAQLTYRPVFLVRIVSYGSLERTLGP